MTDNIIGGIKRNNRIYRIFPQKYFFELFEKNENALVLPEKWPDPYENVILKAPVRRTNGELGTFGFSGDLYGQCWTLHTRSDAMWRLYATEDTDVRVKTRVGKLLDSLSAANQSWTRIQCHIGKVDYLSDTKLRELARTAFKKGLNHETIARTLLVKRDAFEHEREVRLVYFEKDQTRHPGGVFKYPIKPHELFEQVMIAPRMSYDDFVSYRDEIARRTGFPKSKIRRSLLYAPPKDFVVELP